MKPRRERLAALSSIVGIMIGIGITVAAGGTLFYTFQSQIDPFTTSSSLEVRNLNAVLNGDSLSVTATIKNSGQTSITAVYVDEITVSDLTISQGGSPATLGAGDGAGSKAFCLLSNSTSCDAAASDARGFSIHDGAASSPEESDSTLEGGRSGAFVMKIESASAPDLSDVNISDKLNLRLRFTSGQDELVTDVFSTRVKPG